jgi:hypothetical protein
MEEAVISVRSAPYNNMGTVQKEDIFNNILYVWNVRLTKG